MKKLTLMILAVLGLMACSENDMERQGLSGQPIRFSATIADNWNGVTTRSVMQQNAAAQVQQLGNGLYLHTVASQGFERDNNVTRGARYTSTTLNMPFSVSGYRYPSNSSISTVSSANFFYDVTVTQVNSVWTANGNYTWPSNSDRIDFHAYTPVGGAGITPRNETGGLQIDFAIQKDVDDQIDLMTAKAEGETFTTTLGYTVDLPFGHALTSVQFVLDANVAPGTIKQVDLVDIATEGTLHMSTGQWDYTKRETLTLKFSDANDEGGLSTTNNAGFIDTGKEIVSATSPLLMIPQRFLEATQGIRVIIDTGGEQPQTLYATLCPGGVPTSWLPGETVTYKISTSTINKLRMGTVTYPDSWSDASTENSDIKSAYIEGDVFGVYAIDNKGTVQVTNEPMTLTSGGWSGDALFTPGYTYFFYYPYQTGGLAHAGKKGDVVVTTAADFFEEGVANWTPAEDQSSAGNLNASDLQIGTGSLISASTVNPTMTHAMGLTSLTLKSKDVPTTRYYEVLANGNTSSTSYIDSDEETSVTPSENFAASNIESFKAKMLNSGTDYYYIQNPSATNHVVPVVSSSATGIPQWKESSITLTPTAGAYSSYSATVHRDHVYKGLYYTYRSTAETSQSFTAEVAGTYTFECWGAAGGSANNGGYTYGEIELTAGRQLFIYTGKEGDPQTKNYNYSPTASFNGGGSGNNSSTSLPGGGTAYVSGSGGGATDVRTYNSGSSWVDFTGLLSRIMVAGGGGGQAYSPSTPGAGGGLDGLASGTSSGGLGSLRGCSGATQYAGGTTTTGFASGSTTWSSGTNGTFGQGSNGVYQTHPGGGGGGGYFGGAGGAGGGGSAGGVSGSGGSSFISGMAGCQAYEATSTSSNMIKRTEENTAIHHSGLKFNSSTATTINGESLMPCPTGGSETGHAGHGYCRIKTPIVD